MLSGGQRIGRYEITRALGRGGMGTVFLAHDPMLERPVAIKLLETSDSDKSRARILSEARAVSALNHPNICTIYEAGEADGRAFIAMEHVDGRPVTELVPLSVEDAVRYGVEAADALAHAHDRGVVHGDLKAANALITSTGRLKIVDFGLARRVDPDATDVTVSVGLSAPAVGAGTPYAMAPELVRGAAGDPRSDVWALGVLLFEMLVGSKPFVAPIVADLFSAILREPPAPLPPHVPAGLSQIVQKCLAKNPGQRYQRAADVRLVLEVVASDLRRADRTPSFTVIAAGEPLPPPPIVDASSTLAFVGRVRELEQLAQIWTKAQSRHPQLVLLAGEPGIGKTRLSMAFARMVAENGAAVLVGRCDEEGLVPYQPFVEALTWYVRVCSDGDLRAHLAAAGGGAELGQLLPDLLRRRPELPQPPPMSAESQRYRLFEAVSDFLASAGSLQPVLLILDDLHWADKATLLMLRHLVRAHERAAVCILGTYREDELGRTHPLAEVLADLRREPMVTRLSLKGLDEAHVRDLVNAIIGPTALGLARQVRELTDGNPFFAGEILRHVSESGALGASTVVSSAISELALPEGVREVIGRRLSRTSEHCNHVLTTAAVIGREFDVAVLQLLGDLPDDQLLDALDEAATAQLIAETPGGQSRFSFMHALIRETLYGELSSLRRARLHRRVGEALEQLAEGRPNPPLADLAYHFSQAASWGTADKAVDYATRAGDRAVDGLAYEEAARFYDMALHALEASDRLVGDGRRIDLHTRRARAFGALAMWAAEQREAGLALELLPPDQHGRQAELVLMLADTSFYLLDIPGVRRFATEALELAERTGQEDLVADALGWIGRCQQADGDLGGAVETDRAALARGGGRKGVALHHGPLTLYLAGRTSEAVAAGHRAAEQARSFGNNEFAMYGLSHYALALGAAGRYNEAFRVFDEARQFGRRYGMLPPLARAIAMQAGLHLALFDLEGAEALQHEAREMAQSLAFIPTLVSASIDLLLTLARRHDPGRGTDTLLEQTAAAVAATPGWHEWLWNLRLKQARAELALARGDNERAIAEADSAMDQCRARGRLKYEALALLTRAAARQRLGRTRDAIADARAAVDVARATIDPGLQLRATVALLDLDGSDELSSTAKSLVRTIHAALPTDAMRRHFEASEVVVRAMK